MGCPHGSTSHRTGKARSAASTTSTIFDGIADGAAQRARERRHATRGVEIEWECCCSARLAAHFAEQPAGTTTNSEEGGSLLVFHGRKWGALDRESWAQGTARGVHGGGRSGHGMLLLAALRRIATTGKKSRGAELLGADHGDKNNRGVKKGKGHGGRWRRHGRGRAELLLGHGKEGSSQGVACREMWRARGAGRRRAPRHGWPREEAELGVCSSLRDGEAELGEGSRCSTLLGKKGVAAGMPSVGSRGPAMGERPAPWEEGSRAPCVLGKKAPCCAWGKKPGRKMLWRLKEMEGWECKTAKDKGEGSIFIEKP
jgi:hypothetical protein